MAVQFRTNSRETSRAVLDCLSCGIPKIINAHGSMAEYPDDVVVKLMNDFSVTALSNELDNLRTNKQCRDNISKRALYYTKEEHNPKKISSLYHDAIESFAKRGKYSRFSRLISSIATLDGTFPANERDLLSISKLISSNFHSTDSKQLFIDVSAIVENDSKTGIQRVTRSLARELILNPPNKYRIKPSYGTISDIYRYAKKYTSSLYEAYRQ